MFVHYEGRFTDGSVFDSSIRRDKTFKFYLGKKQVIPCWEQAISQMKVGQEAQVTCPPELAYGAKGMPGTIPPSATLIFDIELVSVITPQPRDQT